MDLDTAKKAVSIIGNKAQKGKQHSGMNILKLKLLYTEIY